MSCKNLMERELRSVSEETYNYFVEREAQQKEEFDSSF